MKIEWCFWLGRWSVSRWKPFEKKLKSVFGGNRLWEWGKWLFKFYMWQNQQKTQKITIKYLAINWGIQAEENRRTICILTSISASLAQPNRWTYGASKEYYLDYNRLICPVGLVRGQIWKRINNLLKKHTLF